MGKSRLCSVVGCLVLGLWLGSSSLDRAAAQNISLALPVKLAQSQPLSSDTPRTDADSSEIESKSSLTPAPISPACPFPPIPMSEAASKPLSPFSIEVFTIERGETTFVTFEPGDGSDADLDMTVSNLIREGKLDEALQVAQKIKDVSRKNEALRRIASAYKEAGKLDRAFEVAKTITEPSSQADNSSDDNISVKDNALSEIATAYVEAGQLDKALQVAEIMGEGFKFAILLDIAEKYRAAQQSARAAEVIDRAVAAYRTAAKPYSTDPVAAAYLKLLSLPRFAGQYAAVGQKDRAVDLLSEMFEVAKTLPQQDFWTLTILSSSAELYAGLGQKDKAAQVLSYSLQAAKNIKETFVKALVLAQIANGYAGLKQSDRATELLSQANQLIQPEKGVSEKNVVLIAIARGYGVLEQYDKAFQVTNTVEPASLRDQIKKTLACSQKQGTR